MTKTLRVELGERSYPIHIGAGVLLKSELYEPHIRGRQVMIVSNETVAPLYLDALKADLSGKSIEDLQAGAAKGLDAALLDRLGGGDTWNAGFYYGLLTAGNVADGDAGIRKGVLVGDAATRIKQTLMFDLPVIDKGEVQALMRADVLGGGKRTSR